jgi:hypothetical protein
MNAALTMILFAGVLLVGHVVIEDGGPTAYSALTDNPMLMASGCAVVVAILLFLASGNCKNRGEGISQ